jgi:ABC-2 type transport system permease protein
MRPVYVLTLRQLLGKWRLLILTVLASLPVLVAVLTLRSSNATSVSDFEMVVFSAMLAGSITPLVVLAIASAAFANEIEDSTLANITLSPVPRWKIVVAKLLAAITIAVPFIAASAFFTSQVAFLNDPAATLAVTLSAIVAVALYSSAFVWLGLVTTHAIAIGLLYIVLWEGFFAGFVSGVRLLSIRHYAISVMHVLDARRFADVPNPGAMAAIITSVIVFVGFFLLSVRQLRRMDVP